MAERDTQRKKVYTWENALAEPYSKPLTLEECGQLAAKVCTRYGVPVPRIGDGRGRRVACATAWEVKLPRWARKEWVVLHEVAHVLMERFSPRAAPHGPEFARLLVDLFRLYLHIPAAESRRSAKEHGVKIAAVGAVPRPSTAPKRGSARK